MASRLIRSRFAPAERRLSKSDVPVSEDRRRHGYDRRRRVSSLAPKAGVVSTLAGDTDISPGPNNFSSKVAILLCTMHGQKYLPEQLNSIYAQSYDCWEIWASDDGSKDGTHIILGEYQKAWGASRLSIHSGPAEGFVANFISLVCKAGIQADFYAYADQDDIWAPDKLARAVRWLKSIPQDMPALYCSRTRLVDAHNHDIGFSPNFTRPPSFANALVQNIGGGNTMVFNDAARSLLREAGKSAGIVSHDWWTYMLVSGCGGQVFYDPKPTVRYRQHCSNLVGANVGWAQRLGRARRLFAGGFKSWNERNIKTISKVDGRLTPANRLVLAEFTTARQRWLLPRIFGMKRAGIYRQTFLGNVGLIAAMILNKI